MGGRLVISTACRRAVANTLRSTQPSPGSARGGLQSCGVRHSRAVSPWRGGARRHGRGARVRRGGSSRGPRPAGASARFRNERSAGRATGSGGRRCPANSTGSTRSSRTLAFQRRLCVGRGRHPRPLAGTGRRGPTVCRVCRNRNGAPPDGLRRRALPGFARGWPALLGVARVLRRRPGRPSPQRLRGPFGAAGHPNARIFVLAATACWAARRSGSPGWQRSRRRLL